MVIEPCTHGARLRSRSAAATRPGVVAVGEPVCGRTHGWHAPSERMEPRSGGRSVMTRGPTSNRHSANHTRSQRASRVPIAPPDVCEDLRHFATPAPRRPRVRPQTGSPWGDAPATTSRPRSRLIEDAKAPRNVTLNGYYPAPVRGSIRGAIGLPPAHDCPRW